MSKSPNVFGFVRLENKDAMKGHNKFYEMILKCVDPQMWDVEVKYGRIGTPGKIIPLKGAASRCCTHAQEAFLDQLKSKLKDKEYELIKLDISDKDLKSRIEDLQSMFEGSVKIFEKLELRDF
jgi:predicted DNA-binding WGR domain protein